MKARSWTEQQKFGGVVSDRLTLRHRQALFSRHTLPGSPGIPRLRGQNLQWRSRGLGGQDATTSPIRSRRSLYIRWNAAPRSGARWEHYLVRSKRIFALPPFRSSLSNAYAESMGPIA